jgi:mRNA-degrading endonuclease toxin of MazEF toxin-antitoxin module
MSADHWRFKPSMRLRIVVPLTDAARIKKPSPIYVLIKKGDGGLKKGTYTLCDQIRVVDR